jgi:phosphonoacetaldehyde hydrolase
VDFGSFAPTTAFMGVFASRHVPITIAQARLPMGLMKKDHLRAIVHIPEVEQIWRQVHRKPCDEQDIDAMYTEFEPMLDARLGDHSKLIPGTAEIVHALRQQDIKIGSTTGYSHSTMAYLLNQSEKQGYTPDACVCPSDVPAGRPFPWMCYLNAIQLQTYPLGAMVKVGDTLPDMLEGRNAGMWTVGVAMTGNGLGMTELEVTQMTPDLYNVRREAVYRSLLAGGAHYVIDGIWDLLPVIDEINQRLARGEHP